MEKLDLLIGAIVVLFIASICYKPTRRVLQSKYGHLYVAGVFGLIFALLLLFAK